MKNSIVALIVATSAAGAIALPLNAFACTNPARNCSQAISYNGNVRCLKISIPMSGTGPACNPAERCEDMGLNYYTYQDFPC
jgi:hypothetical protein